MDDKQKYLLDCGYLLSKDNENYERYACYDENYGYFDELQEYDSNLSQTIKKAKAYVNDSINKYAVVSKAKKTTILSVPSMDDVIIDDCNFNVEDIVYSIMSNNEGKIIENFIKGEK